MRKQTQKPLHKPLWIVLAVAILVCLAVVAVYAGSTGGTVGKASAPLAQRNSDGIYVYSVDTNGDHIAELDIADADVDSIRYLSDLHATDAKLYSFVTGPGGKELSGARDFTPDKNFSSKVLVFTAPNNAGRREVNSSNSPRTLAVDGKDTVYKNTDIVLGAKGTIFTKGLGFLTSNPANKSVYPAQLIYDMRNVDADYFYAVAGMLGTGNTEANSKNGTCPVTYQVWGSKAESYADATAARTASDWEELAKVEKIDYLYTAEFNVKVTGYNYIKLTAANMGTTHSGSESAWGNACFYKLATTSVSADVVWNNGSQPAAERPTSVEVQLYADGTAVADKKATLNADNGWKVEWKDLPKYQEGTVTEIAYTVQTVSDPDYYRKNISGTTITYTYDASLVTADVPVSVAFEDGDSDGTKRPTEITVQLCADGTEVQSATLTLNAANSWAGKFEKQPVYTEGGAATVEYTFKVTTTSAFYSMTADGSVIRCNFIPAPKTSFTSALVWDDNDDAMGFRPGNVTVQLYADGTAVAGKSALANEANGWACEWTDLTKYNEERTKEIVYSAKLSADPDQYEVTASGNNFTLKCVPNVNFTAAVTWEDSDNAQNTRPASVAVQLYADGKPVSGKTATLNAANNWKVEWKKLPKYQEGTTTEIAYTVAAAGATDYVQSVENGNVTYTHVVSNATKATNLGKTGVLAGLPSEATDKNTFYLSDLLNGKNSRVVDQFVIGENNSLNGRKFKAFENYDGKLFVFQNATNRQQITAHTTIGGVEYYPTDIAMGANGTVFDDGISFYASPAAGPDAFIIYDLTGLDADYFYAVTGVTGDANINDGGPKNFYLTFEVWGSKTGDAADYVKLAYSADVRAYLLNEFKVPITGYNYLKLVARNTGVSNEGGAAAWADACVYTLTSTDPVTPPVDNTPTLEHGDTSKALNYTASADGNYKGIVKAADGSIIALSDQKYVKDSYILPSGANPNRTVRIDTTDLNNDGRSVATIGKADHIYEEHLTLHPTEISNSKKAFADLDLTGLDVDRLYAAVGISTSSGKTGNKGVIFSVYGLDEQSNTYKMLATSAGVYGYDSGEFNVDITGYQKLKLMVELTADAADHYSRTSSWCDISAYKYDPNAAEPEPEKPTEPRELSGYTHTANGAYTGVQKAKNGKVNYLSALTAASSSNNNNNPTTRDYPYAGQTGDPITVGAKDITFKYGLGVHPKSGTAEAYTVYDLTKLDVDRFHAVVGITNENGKKGSSEGVIFKVYADFEGSGKYELISQSGTITKKDSGEFDVDITGAKSLKLTVVTATGKNASSGSAWAGASVYKYDAKGTAPASITTEPASQPTEPTKLGGYTGTPKGVYTGVTKAKDGKVTYLSNLTYTKSANNNNKPTTNNYPYAGKTGDPITVGAKDTTFKYGLGIHPKSGTNEVYTIYDLTKQDVDRFHAVVGITNENGKKGSSEGVIFKVYADYKGDGSYQLISQSGTITKKNTGEFDVDITGAKSLKLAAVSATGNNASSGAAWAGACVYKYDAKGKAPAKITSTGSASASTGTNDLTNLQPTKGFTLSADGEFTGVDKGYRKSIVYLSDYEYLDSSNTTNADFPKGQPTTRNFTYNSTTELIAIGEMDRVFFNGLGMHPKSPTAPVDGTIESWTTYSLKGIQGDRFHATVGITNTKGKDGASKGVVFRVYGENGDGVYKLLAHSGAIVGRMSGEFDLDITGMKTLKLAVVCAGNAHTSSACAFADACIYDSTKKVEDEKEEIIIIPTEATEPAPTEPVPGEEKSAPTALIVAGVSVLGLAVIGGAILLLTKGKKKKDEK